MNFLNHLNGMFSMVIIDEKMNKKYLVKDRYGKNHCTITKVKRFIL